MIDPARIPSRVDTLVSAPVPAADAEAEALVARLLDSMSVRDKAAQLVMPWLPGNYAAFDDETFAREQRWVDSLHVGAVLISVGSPLDVAVKLNDLQRRSPLPLLVAADLEAGTSVRLNGGTPFPSNMGVGAAGGERDAYDMGRITAIEARAVGIHLAFAPVADVNSNPANPIINTRSFGEDPRAVGRLVAAQVRGMQDYGLLATVKHFPGHGDTETDSHLAMPSIASGWPRLDSIEMVPFRAAVDAGVTAVMSAHIALPALDGGRIRPATLVPAILTGILRDSLHFRGLIATDALNMAGLGGASGAAESSVLAFLAGADLFVQPADPVTVIDAIARSVASGRISAERLDSSVSRVLLLKARLGLFARRTVSLDSIPIAVGRAASLATAQDIAARALVLVKDSAGTVDRLRRGGQRIGYVSYVEDIPWSAGTTLPTELRTRGFPVTAFRLYPNSGAASYDSARATLQRGQVAIIAASVRATAWRGTITMPDSLAALITQSAAARPTVLVSLGSPYLINQTPSVTSYLLAWAGNAVTERAVADALAGQAPITGRLPISLPPAFLLGFGLQRPPACSGSPHC